MISMTITYIVGNGLDIQFGLATKYTDFYNDFDQKNQLDNSYRKNNSVYNSIKSNKDNAEEGKEWDKWADFEKGIGDLTKTSPLITRSQHSIDLFIKDFRQVSKDLKEYLGIQQENFKPNQQIDFRDTIFKTIINAPEMKKGLVRIYKERLVTNEINILSLNYTDSLEKLIKEKNIMVYLLQT